MQYSIIIPVHNEGANIYPYVAKFIQKLPSDLAGILKEIIIVENGSTDNTPNACRLLAQGFPNLIKIVTIGKGSYGEAIKQGMLHSTGTHLSILECDFLDPRFVSASMAIFESDRAQFVVGSKRHPRSIDRRTFTRRALTAGYNFLFLHLFIGYPGSDTHGLKSIETSLAKKLCQIAITTDEVFQTELVLLAWRLGIKIEEVPVEIWEMRQSTVSVVRRLPKVLNTLQALQRSLGRFEHVRSNGPLREHRRTFEA
jgi:glycosyltransferase involved in cell wall biosynthesis